MEVFVIETALISGVALVHTHDCSCYGPRYAVERLSLQEVVHMQHWIKITNIGIRNLAQVG